jgi:hypothetical protein
MQTLYRNGTVQKTVDRISAVAVKFDDTKSKYVKIATFDGNRNSVEELVAFAKEHST